MAKTSIEWTSRDGNPGHTWNPLKARLKADVEIKTAKGLKVIPSGKVGYHCEHVSPGCVHCYAESMNGRCLPAWGTGLDYSVPNRDKVEIFIDEKVLLQPLKWKPGTTAFVCSMTDLFADFVPDELIDRVFAVMALSGKTTFQVLTKRADRALAYMSRLAKSIDPLEAAARKIGYTFFFHGFSTLAWPIGNLWMGVSVENQKYADERIPLLLQTPAAVRFVSYEPMLGPVDFQRAASSYYADKTVIQEFKLLLGIDWLIAGFESGTGARTAEVDWVRSARDQCIAARIAFFYKQSALRGRKIPTPELDGQRWMQFPAKATETGRPPRG